MAYFRCTGNSGGSLKLLTASGDIASFETNLPEPLQSVIVNVLATGGNGTPDNPNPINGYTEANITRCGVNLLPPYTFSDGGGIIISSNNGTYVISGTTTAYYQIIADTSFILKAGTYTLKNNGNVNNNLVVQLRSTDGLTTYATSSINSDTFTINTDTEVKFRMTFNNVGSYSATISPQLEVGSQATAYTPYTGNTYTIAFGQTVYGGVLDVTRGKLHVTHRFVELDGSNDEYWALQSINSYGIANFATIVTPTFNNSGLSLCNRFEKQTTTISDTSTEGYYLSSVETIYIRINATRASTVADMRTWLSNNNVQFVYELATPFDIDLTPEVIFALEKNNVFADCGETEVKYLKAE